MPEVTHLVNGKVTSKEHFEQVTQNAEEPEGLSPIERLTRLEHAVFPHLKPGETSDAT